MDAGNGGITRAPSHRTSCMTFQYGQKFPVCGGNTHVEFVQV